MFKGKKSEEKVAKFWHPYGDDPSTGLEVSQFVVKIFSYCRLRAFIVISNFLGICHKINQKRSFAQLEHCTGSNSATERRFNFITFKNSMKIVSGLWQSSWARSRMIFHSIFHTFLSSLIFMTLETILRYFQPATKARPASDFESHIQLETDEETTNKIMRTNKLNDDYPPFCWFRTLFRFTSKLFLKWNHRQQARTIKDTNRKKNCSHLLRS